MKKADSIHLVLGERLLNSPTNQVVSAFAPSNIALCKYWGKRDAELNLPVTSSLSISLADRGTTTRLSVIDEARDKIDLNGQPVDLQSSFAKRVIDFLNLFRGPSPRYFYVDTHSNIPIAAGLASSASGFASLVLALNALFRWELSNEQLSILARLGSGSACRSLWSGFVEWQQGERSDGMDSVGMPIDTVWDDFCIGLLMLSTHEKPISSREAMQRTVVTSPFYASWPAKVQTDLGLIKQAIAAHDFDQLCKTAESNALAMHATMLTSWPPISYYLPETIKAMQSVWQLRAEGVPVYFTQDAGPNLKLLFVRADQARIQSVFQSLVCVSPF